MRRTIMAAVLALGCGGSNFEELEPNDYESRCTKVANCVRALCEGLDGGDLDECAMDMCWDPWKPEGDTFTEWIDTWADAMTCVRDPSCGSC